MALKFLIGLLLCAGVVDSQRSCLTWELEGNTLSLICRIQNKVDPVSFNDSKGHLKAKCILKNPSKCETFQIKTNTSVNTYKNEIVLIINDYDRQRFINDEWSCSQGNRTWTTVVSTSKGILSDTDLTLSLLHSSRLQSVTLICFSCRAPHGHHAEFLKDDKSEDSIRYNIDTRKCTNMNGECLPDMCSCIPSGNEFIRILPFITINKTMNFSCRMKFVDHDKSSIFSLISKVSFNGQEFIYNGTNTIISKPAINDERRNMSDGKNNNQTDSSLNIVNPGDIIKWIGIGVAFSMPCVVAVIVKVCCRSIEISKRKNDENEPTSQLLHVMGVQELSDRQNEKHSDAQCPLIKGAQCHVISEEIEAKSDKGFINKSLETWSKRDALYYETKFFKRIKDALATDFCVTIIGAAGEGKTVTARHAALKYKNGEQPYTILPIDDPTYLLKSIKLDKRQFIIIEDPLGKQHLDEAPLSIWYKLSKVLRHSLIDSKIKIVVTMRKSVFRYYQTRIKDTIFHANVIDLSSESDRLSIEEKQGILEQHMKSFERSLDRNIKQLIVNETYYPGFPLMCHRLSADFNLIQDSKLDPYPMLIEHINEFSSSLQLRYQYCCLVLAFMHNFAFDINDFTLYRNADFAGNDDEVNEKIENIIRSCNISSRDENCFSYLKNGFESLSGSFFAYKPPIYTILHESITRAVAYIYGIVNTRILLEYSNSAVIREFVRIKCDTNERIYSKEKIIIDPICQKQLTNLLAKRFVRDIEQGNTSDVFRNPSCLNETFQRIFYKVLYKSDDLLQLMSRSTKQTTKSIRYSKRIDKDTKCPFDNIISLCTPVHWLCSLGLKLILELVMSRSENKPEFINSLPGRVKPLHIAAGHGHLEIVKYLIEDICVNVNEQLDAKSEDDPQIDERYAEWSPLHFAASQNFQEVVAYLLQNKADPNLINDHGCSSMLLAAGHGYATVVEYLLNYGGKPNLSCNDGTTPLMLAAQEGHFDTMLTLIDGKADVNLQNNEEKSKQSALFLAAKNGRIQCVKTLIDKGADKELSDIHKTSPLLVALLNEKYETAKHLFQIGASINAKNKEGKSPLEITESLNINVFD